MRAAPAIASRLLLVAPVLLAAGCGGSTSPGTAGPGGCTSFYEPVAAAASEKALERILVHSVDPKVTSVRVLVHKPADGKKTINLLDRNKRVVRSLDMWRKKDGTWVAQQWNQCID